jgi:hypothetical protein
LIAQINNLQQQVSSQSKPQPPLANNAPNQGSNISTQSQASQTPSGSSQQQLPPVTVFPQMPPVKPPANVPQTPLNFSQIETELSNLRACVEKIDSVIKNLKSQEKKA